MSRIRTVKPDFWRDDALSSVSAEAALLAIGLLNHSDDEGYFNANPKLIEADVFPLRELSSSITVLLRELSKIGYLTMFLGSDGKKYGLVSNFTKHQVINKPKESKIKELCSLPDHSGNDTVSLLVGMEGNGKGMEKEREVVVRATALSCPPDVDEVLWNDWKQLRKSKRAGVTATVVEEARKEAAKAQMSLSQFLKEWCLRGSQGLKAEWLTNNQNDKRTEHQKRQDASAKALLGDAYYAAPTMKTIEGEVIHEEPPFTRRLG